MTTTNTLYVERDLVIEFIRHNPELFLDEYAQAVFWELLAITIPSIPNPIEEIDKMQEEIKNGIDPWHVTMLSARATLEELKSRRNKEMG